MSILKFRQPVAFCLAVAASALVTPQAMACFTVYNSSNVPVYSNMSPPIDMSYQIHQRLPAVFPGGHMVFGASPDCPLIDVRVLATELPNSGTMVSASNRRVRKASRN